MKLHEECLHFAVLQPKEAEQGLRKPFDKEEARFEETREDESPFPEGVDRKGDHHHHDKEDEKEDDHRLDRYNYLYKRDQLDPWVPQIKEAELKESKVRIYFNNHARAKSVRNAFLLMDRLLIDHKQKEIKSQDQFTLGEF